MFKKASSNIMNINLHEVSKDAIEGFKKSFGQMFTPLDASSELAKTLTTANALVGYNLAPYLPVLEPFFPINNIFRNKIPRITPLVKGAMAQWNVVNSVTSGKSSTVEGKRGRTTVVNTSPKTASYKTTLLGGSVTLQAQAEGEGYIDAKAKDVLMTLSKFMQIEEKKIVGGNITTLGDPAAPTATAGSGGSLAAADLQVKVAYLTYEVASSVQKNIQKNDLALPADYDSDNAVISGQFWGVTKAIGLASAVTVTENQKLTCTCTAKAGAGAYAWFVGTAGNEVLQIITTNPSVVISSLSTGGSAASTSDGSADTLSYDGIVPQVVENGTAAGNLVNQANAELTPNDGGVKEIDDMLDYIYGLHNVVPTDIYCAPAQMRDVATAVQAGNSNNFFSVNVANGNQNILTANYAVDKYIHKTTGQVVNVHCHAYLPDGTILFLTENLNAYSIDVPYAMAMHCAIDYFQLDYAPAAPANQYDIMTHNALAMYHPKACGLIYNVKNGITIS